MGLWCRIGIWRVKKRGEPKMKYKIVFDSSRYTSSRGSVLYPSIVIVEGTIEQARRLAHDMSHQYDAGLTDQFYIEEVRGDLLMTHGVDVEGVLRRQPGCHAAKDGDCNWVDCPQLRDNEPHATGRHCPLDREDEERVSLAAGADRGAGGGDEIER